MKVGIIGLGMVGGTLHRWFKKNTEHKLVGFDPAKAINDDFEGTDAVFISVPVPPAEGGQDLSTLLQSVHLGKKYCENVFIRSSVLPGTADTLRCISSPEFLTARRSDEDMDSLPILVGQVDKKLIETIFPGKKIIMVSNVEAELTKFTHNCFGAMKVTYFNLIHRLCTTVGADYSKVLDASMLTGFIEREHTMVPGPDGKYGFGGTCFPGNIEAMRQFMRFINLDNEFQFFDSIRELNRVYRDRVGDKFVDYETPELDA